jgi:hypothetical protein
MNTVEEHTVSIHSEDGNSKFISSFNNIILDNDAEINGKLKTLIQESYLI